MVSDMIQQVMDAREWDQFLSLVSHAVHSGAIISVIASCRSASSGPCGSFLRRRECPGSIA